MRPHDPSDKIIALVLYPGLAALDFVGPLQVLKVFETIAPEYHVVAVGERAEPLDTDVRVQMVPDKTFDEVPHPYAIVVPGGRIPTIRAMSDPTMRAYLRRAAETAEIVASVCTGSLILAALGLLEGRRATTNWFFDGVLDQFGAKFVPQRWVEDGKFIMSAGVSAGIDMALYLVARLTDEPTARRVQIALDYDPLPPFGNIDWANVPTAPRVVRRAIRLAAPLVAARPKRLIREERRLPATVPHAIRA